ncbi:growth arrest and DNA damage-inducible protein GADD45 alpha-like [Babylonia areolata]|uniref:growth arrest and DNA damage-inducible protein GADD45 alpha-like n=1 Tax=Babylonia areolata TaxID=304850 RepID=UPI003FD6A1FA
MTLTDCEESACCNSMQPTLDQQESLAIGLALREAVWQAQEQGRLRCGVMECAQLLEIDPFNVMMCVMPVSGPDDVSGIIERTLIEAFCHEYQIRLIKVDSVNKLRKVLEGREGTARAAPSPAETGLPPLVATPNATQVPTSTATPLWELCRCVLVQYPESGEASEEEETVAQHYKKTTVVGHEDNFSAVVALPDD